MAAVDTFVRLIQDLRRGQLQDDTDPNNIILNRYTSPYDQTAMSESVKYRVSKVSSMVWGDGTTYTAYDSNGDPYQAPSCGWTWGNGGRWN